MNAATDIRIRDARPDDAAAIARVHVECWQEAYAGQLPDPFLERLPETLDRREQLWRGVAKESREGTALFVAEKDNEVIGFAYVLPSRDADADASVGEVGAIYLRKQWWGRGIGRELFGQGVQRLREFGFTSAMLWVLDSNERTRRFYEAAGWKLDGGEKVEQARDVTLREVRYRIDLNE